MKASLYVLLSLLVAAAAVFAGSLFLPDTYAVSRSIIVKAKPEQVFAYLNNPTQWEHWNAWNKTYDPTMIRLYGGPLTGKGAYQEWNGDRIGQIKMRFTESLPPTQLQYSQQAKGDHFAWLGTFDLEAVEAGTKVSWVQQTQVADDMLNKYRGFLQKLKTEQETEESLLSLKHIFEPAASTSDKSLTANRKGRN